MKIIKKQSEEEEPPMTTYAIHHLKDTSFEVIVNDKLTLDNPIHSIVIERGLWPGQEFTIYFGNFGHIHLDTKLAKELFNGLRYVENEFPYEEGEFK